MMRKKAQIFLLLLLLPQWTNGWGFFGHQLINRLAVYTLPPEMIRFYKFYIHYISENSVNPDKRRYAVEGEAQRHFIDIDVYDPLYNDSAVYKMPRYWREAVARHGEDSLQAYGIVPWHIVSVMRQLTEAFAQKEIKRILRLSADLGHYIADANVPLHTTENYNGQLTNQLGIHAFWESRLPELFSEDYNFFTGKAEYLQNSQLRAWEAIIQAHQALDSVLSFEKKLSEKFPEDKKYTLEERNMTLVKTYSRKFSQAYHDLLNGQVERQMKASVKMFGDFLYTCWVDAGQPDLNRLLEPKALEEEKEELEKQKKIWEKIIFQSRPHEVYIQRGLLEKLKLDCCYHKNFFDYYKRMLLKKNNFKFH